jgi:hypothetical protein
LARVSPRDLVDDRAGLVEKEPVAHILEGAPDTEPEIAAVAVWHGLRIPDESIGVEEGSENEGDDDDDQHLAGVHGPLRTACSLNGIRGRRRIAGSVMRAFHPEVRPMRCLCHGT